MSDPQRRPLRDIARLLAYARPYLPLVVLTISFSLLYAGGLTGRAALLGPILDGIAVPSAQLDSVVDLIGVGGAETAPEQGAETAPEQGAETAPEQDAETRELVENIRSNFRTIVLAALLLVFGMPLVRLVRDYTGEWLMTRMFVDVQADLGTKLLRMPLAQHVSGSSGDFVARTTSDTVVARRVQMLVFGEGIQDAAIMLAVPCVAVYLNWRLAGVALLLGPPIAAVMLVFGSRIRKRSHRRQLQVSEVMQRMLHILDGIKTIKAFQAEGLERGAFEREVMRFFRRSMSVIRPRVYSRAAVEAITQLSLVLVLLVGVWALSHRMWGLTIGQFGAFVAISLMTYRPMKNLTRLYNAVQDAIPATGRIFEVLDGPEERPDAADAVSLTRLGQGIRYRAVSFSYGREPVLRDVDLEIGAGESVAIVGRTGAGKTTLADLLLGFYEPDAGSIELDGVDLRHIRRASLRELMAVVTQEAFLFDTTILENVRYGRPDATFEEVVEAARAANAHEFIGQLPDGYDTECGERGAQLSGGQRQRIAIARALLCDPEILIFDEATSALDAKAERLVQEATANLMKGRTVLIIAHRLATVRAADRIAVLEEGRVQSIGTHDELMASDPLYRELVELQRMEPSSPE